jgi:predicted enzyme related to lactoylglutathione lyase
MNEEKRMSSTFVWFHNHSEKPADSTTFYEELLGWKRADGPPGMTMLAAGAGPVAGLGGLDGVTAGWVPFVQVEDVDTATKRATKLGATVVKPRVRGPAGDYTIVRDPGGAAFALWQKA